MFIISKILNLILFVIAALSLQTCFKWDNPVDPQNITSELISPKNLKAEQIDSFQYLLSWEDECRIEEGFKIDRKDGNGTWQIDYVTVGANVTEHNVNLSGTTPEETTIKWRIRAYFEGYISEYSNEALLVPNTVATPIATPTGATYNNAQTVSLSTETIGATIRYTLDSSVPSETSAIYAEPIHINANTTIKAKAYKSGWKTSPVSANAYNMVVATPTFTPGEGWYTIEQRVSISCATIGVTIRYTINGTEPTESSSVYSTPLMISPGTTLKAKAFKVSWTTSQTTTAVYLNMATHFVQVQGGTFNNGTSDVTLSSFYISNNELTQSEYQAVMGTNPSYFPGVTNGPVEQVSWFNAIEYCNRRSIQEGLTPCYSYSTYGTNPASWPGGWNSNSGNHTNVTCNWIANGYRLPTEAEWHYAARGGNQTHNYTYSGSNDINAVAWYGTNSSSTTHTVGTKTANELGIYDMSGNVWEWCWDIYGSYPSGTQINPRGSSSGSNRVKRGGCWLYIANDCTVSYRSDISASHSDLSMGFRCVRVSP